MDPKKIPPAQPDKKPGKHNVPEMPIPIDPEEPPVPEEDPDIIPDEEPFETPPYEVPEPGEGP